MKSPFSRLNSLRKTNPIPNSASATVPERVKKRAGWNRGGHSQWGPLPHPPSHQSTYRTRPASLGAGFTTSSNSLPVTRGAGAGPNRDKPEGAELGSSPGNKTRTLFWEKGVNSWYCNTEEGLNSSKENEIMGQPACFSMSA